jgi:xanthine dehydrogenase accessory factor
VPWRTQIGEIAEPCVLVSIASAEGSTPRERGTQMIVMADALHGTIGGGNLEFKAIEIARARLASQAFDRHEHRFALGPSLGQCCGGAVTLAFEGFDAAGASALARRLAAEYDASIDWSIQLYGAGHVGQAIVAALAPLACRITWIDERSAQFPALRPANVTIRSSDVPADEVASASPGAYYLVLTHSHALDEDVCAKILARGDFAYLGLIGSATKRALFERRLQVRGIAAPMLARMTCPIGIAGIDSKEPAAIAVAVVAELLVLRERQRSTTTP